MASFLRTWFTALAVLALLVIGLNLLVDPYDVFGTPRLHDISVLKPGAKNHTLLAKTYQIQRAHPVTVLIGSSSTHIGIDAAASAWPAAMRPVYNYGIPGGYAASNLSTLWEAIADGDVRYAVVAFDFQSFLFPESSGGGLTEDQRRFHTLDDGTTNPYRTRQVMSDMFLSVATMGALTDSLKTLIGQANPGLLDVAANGSANEADFIGVAADGMHDLFAQKDGFELERATQLKRIMAGWEGDLPNLDLIRRIIALAHEHGVKLTLVITPHHADALEIYWRLGLWPRIEQMKVALAGVAAEGGDVPVWDFLDYGDYSTEAVPAAGDRRTQTRWFWEPSHFKKRLGALMIANMFGQGAPAFGTMLTPANVAARNNAVRAQREALVCGAGVKLLTSMRVSMPDGCPDDPAGTRLGQTGADRKPL